MIKKSKEASQLSDDMKNTLKSAGEYAYVPYIKKAEYNDNIKEIERLRLELEDLIAKSNNGLVDLTAEKSELIAKIDTQITSLKRSRSPLYNKIKALDDENELSKVSLQSDFNELQKFFPEADIEAISLVESFHKDISSIFKSQVKELRNKTWNMINIINAQINELEDRKIEIGCTTKIPKLMLERHTAISKKISELQKENEMFDKLEELKKQSKKDKDELERVIIVEGSKLADRINEKMKQICEDIFPDYQEPKLTITKTENYEFETMNDEGTGTNYKGLILFDLSVLSITDVPAIAHDSVTIKNISENVTEKLYDLYATFEKQIFAVIDRTNTYNEGMQQIVSSKKVLHLSSNGNELFGRSWAKKTENKE